MANFRLRSNEGTVTSNIQGTKRERTSDMSDEFTLPFNLHEKTRTTSFQTSSSLCAGSQENDEDIIIEGEIKNQNSCADGVPRGTILVFQSEESTVDDTIEVISHTNIPPRISPSDAERIKNEVRMLQLERDKKWCAESNEYSHTRGKVKHSVRVPNRSACSDTTTKAVECLPFQNKSQHSHNSTDISSNVDQSAVLSKSTTTFSSKDGNIVTGSEVSKSENKSKVPLNTVRALANRELVLEDTSISLKNITQDILPISEKNNIGNSTIICKNEMFPATASYRRTQSTLPLVDCEVLEYKIMHPKNNTDTCTATCENVMPVTTTSGMVAGLSSGSPKLPVERESVKKIPLSRKPSGVRNQRALSSDCKILLPRSKAVSQNKIENKAITPPRTDSNIIRQCRLPSEHPRVSPSKMSTGKTDVRKGNDVIKASENSGSQYVICPLSHLKRGNDVRSVLEENISSKRPCISDHKPSTVLQSKSSLEESTSMQESNNSSTDSVVLEPRPAANLNCEKSSSPVHVSNVTNLKCLVSNVKKLSPVTVIIEDESDTLISTVCNTVPSHKEAKILKGPNADWEVLISKSSSLHLREESVKCNVRMLQLERDKKWCAESNEYSHTRGKVKHSVRVPNRSACSDTTTEAVECLPFQNKSQHSHNSTDISSNVDQSAVLSKSTTTFSSKDGNIVTGSEVSKSENKPKVPLNTVRALANRELVLEDTSISLKNITQDILPISEKNNIGKSTIICKNEMFPATASYRRTQSTLPLVDCEVLEYKIMHPKNNTDTCTATCENVMPVTTTSGMVAGLSSGSPKLPVERESVKKIPLSRKPSGVRNQRALSSDCKILLPRSKAVSQNKIENKAITPPRTDSNIIRQCRLPSEHPRVSPSKMSTGKTDVRKGNDVIKASENSGSQYVICPLSHLKRGNDVRSVLEENISSKRPCISDHKPSTVLQSKSSLEESTSMQESNNSSTDSVVLEPRPAANLNCEKSSSPVHVSNVTNMKCLVSNVKKPSPVTVIIEDESDTLISTVCNTVPSHKEAKILKGPNADWEVLNSKSSSLHLREESVKCNFSKSSEVYSTSSSEKQVSVPSENMHSSLERGKATTDYKAPPASGTKLDSVGNKLHYYMSLLFSGTEREESDTCSLSSDKGNKTKLPSTEMNMLIHNPDVVSKIRQNSSPSISVACKGSTSTAHEQIVHISLCSDVKSKGKEDCRSPEVKKKETSDCTARNNTVSIVHKSIVPGSVSGSSVTCTGSTATIPAQSPTVLCNTLGNKCMQPATTVSELQIIQPESQSVKLSHEVSRHPSKFCVVERNSFDILMTGQKISQKKSPSKRLCNSSPIKYVIKNRSPHKRRYRTVSPNKTQASKVLEFDSCGTETKSGSLASTNPENQSTVSEFSYSHEYVGYFEAIIAEVLKDRDLLSLLIEEEVTIVTNFWKLENQVKKLYVRMLSRKYTWHRVSDIKYYDINVPAAFIELEVSGFVTSDYSSEELGVLLNMLKVPELRSLCQTFRIPSATQPKSKLIQALLAYGRTQQTISGNERSDSASLIKSRLREALGHCIKLCAEGREGFLRIMLLFSLPHQDDEEDGESSKQLLLMHYVKTRKVEFPTYIILKTLPIFSSRNDLIRFQKASEVLTGLMKAVANKRWDEAHTYGQQAREHFRTVIEDSAQNDYARTLPLFIRRYTAGSTYAYAMTKSIEAFKKCKDHVPEYVIILQELLSQHIYLPQYRGKWYEQLALLLQVHLKNCEQAAAAVIEAMKDDHLSEVDQQMLSSRGTRLLRSKGLSNDLKQKLGENIKEPLKDPPNVKIKAKSMQGSAPGRKRVYIQEDAHIQETTYSSVEEYAINHYKSKGYTEGIHDEGSAIKSLFGLIFWDVIYEHPVPDVFRSSYQQVPLDLYSGEFYRNRKEAVDKRLESLCHWDMNCVREYMERILKEHEGKESIVNWQMFRNLQQIVELINCIGVEVLSKILERLVKNYRVVRSGFPDLLVWNPITSEYKFVEVKGPGDRLSVAQNMWLNYLTKCNANAEVCCIETSGAKAVKRKMKNVPASEDVRFTC